MYDMSVLDLGGGEEGGRGPQEKKAVKETCAKGFFGLSRG
jgi:hypothetical protein